MALTHGRNSVFKLDDLSGSLQDISTSFRSVSGLRESADRPDVKMLGDIAGRHTVLGVRDGGSISVSGFFKHAGGIIHGRQGKLLFGEYSLVQRVESASVKRGRGMTDVNMLGEDWKTRLPQPEAGSLSVQGWWNGATGEIDDILAPKVSVETPVVSTLAPYGLTIGYPVDLAYAAIQPYSVENDAENPVRFSADFVADGPVDHGVALHDLVAETGASPVAYASVNEVAATTNGGVGHLHVTALTGTNAVIKIQHSTNDSVWTDLVTFVSATAVGSQRIEVTGTVNQYVRAQVASGTYSSVTFSVAFARRSYLNATAGSYRHLAGLFWKTLTSETSSWEYGPQGGTAGYRKYSGECFISSLDITVSENNAIEFTAELTVSGAVTRGTF